MLSAVSESSCKKDSPLLRELDVKSGTTGHLVSREHCRIATSQTTSTKNVELKKTTLVEKNSKPRVFDKCEQFCLSKTLRSKRLKHSKNSQLAVTGAWSRMGGSLQLFDAFVQCFGTTTTWESLATSKLSSSSCSSHNHKMDTRRVDHLPCEFFCSCMLVQTGRF